MNKKIIAKSVIVLSIITVVVVAILAVVNEMWHISPQERFTRAVSNLIVSDDFELIYDGENSDGINYKEVLDFNTQYGAAGLKVNTVRKAVGGRDDGYLLFESTGRGYRSKFVKVFIGYDKDGKITGVSLSDADRANNLIGYIDWGVASNNLRGKTYQSEVGKGNDIIANTGATEILEGVAEAIELSNQFYKNLILGQKETAQIVTDATTIAQINTLFNINESEYKDVGMPTQYIKYPIRTGETAALQGTAIVSAVYYADQTYVILEIESSSENYGNWTLLILLHNEKDTIAAINPLYSNNIPFPPKNIDATILKGAGQLTATYKDVSKDEIFTKYEYLHGLTRATQTIHGLEAGVYHALDQQVKIKESLANYIAKEEANE